MAYLNQLHQKEEQDSHFSTYLPPKTRKLFTMSMNVHAHPLNKHLSGTGASGTFGGSCVPWIRFMTPRTDVCNRCELHRQAVKNATNEYEKQESLKRFSEHLESAQLERKLYREATDKATKELKAHKGGLT